MGSQVAGIRCIADAPISGCTARFVRHGLYDVSRPQAHRAQRFGAEPHKEPREGWLSPDPGVTKSSRAASVPSRNLDFQRQRSRDTKVPTNSCSPPPSRAMRRRTKSHRQTSVSRFEAKVQRSGSSLR